MIRRALARINDRLDETDAGTVIVCSTIFMGVFLAALIWGGALITDLVLVAGVVSVAWYAGTVGSRADRASDDADVARGKTEAIEDHLTGLEPHSGGRHSDTRPRPYPRRPVPQELP
jgi:hypothetical protein